MSINVRLKMVLFAIPWLIRMLSVKRLARKYRKTPELVHSFQRYSFLLGLSKKLLRLYNIDLEVRGKDNLPKNGSVILAPNHKSYTDVLALIAALEKEEHQENIEQRIPTFVAKKELGDKFSTKHALKLLDSFLIDPNDFRKSLKVLGEFAEFVRKNQTFGIVFPEAHRIEKEELGDFKAGAFKAALQSYLPVVPVAISGTLNSFSSTKKGRTKVIVSFLPVLKAREIIAQEPSAVANRVKQLISNELEGIKNNG
ncbi:lysophospholipid acyltransferase family protein [Mycoplasmopsis edwardii]|nr:lysophospholipid acyltransferase family protein [Mycoplasmopsis edwardii]